MNWADLYAAAVRLKNKPGAMPKGADAYDCNTIGEIIDILRIEDQLDQESKLEKCELNFKKAQAQPKPEQKPESKAEGNPEPGWKP